jgi:hypothetical protein
MRCLNGCEVKSLFVIFEWRGMSNVLVI